MNETAYKNPRQRKYTLEEKKEILERWRNSSMAKIKFCKEQDIAPSTLYQWLNQLEDTLQARSMYLSAVRMIDKKEMPTKEETGQTLMELSLSTQAVVRFKLPIKDLVAFVTELAMQLQLYGNKIWLFRKPIDFRRGIDGLSSLIVMELNYKPQEGIFIFYNRHRDKIKCLSWHKNGFILLYKRLERGRFHVQFNKTLGVCEMSTQELSWALAGLEWQTMRDWGDLDYGKFS